MLTMTCSIKRPSKISASKQIRSAAFPSPCCATPPSHCQGMQAVSESLSNKVMREARAQQEELDAEDRPAGGSLQACTHLCFISCTEFCLSACSRLPHNVSSPHHKSSCYMVLCILVLVLLPTSGIKQLLLASCIYYSVCASKATELKGNAWNALTAF